MDFLLGSARQLRDVDVSRLDRYALSRRNGPLTASRLQNTIVVAPRQLQAAPPEDGFVALDGYVISADGLHHPFFAGGIESAVAAVEADPMVHGVFVAAHVKPDGHARVYSDVIGQYPVFYWAEGDAFLVSNNCHLIEQSLAMMGRRPRRSARSVAYTLCYGTSFGDEAAVEDVQVVPARHGLEAHVGGLRVTELVTAHDVYIGEGSYEDLLEQAQGELRSAAAAIAASPVNDILCDLTGGKDSRLTLASFLAVGAQDRVSVHCTARYPRADRIVVDYLAHKYGLRGADAVMDNQLRSLPLIEKLRRGVFRNFGLKLTDSPDVGELMFPSIARVSGYFGEMSRSFGGRIAAGADANTIAEAYYARRDARSSYITEDSRSELVKATGDYLQSILDEGIEPTQANKVMYCEQRSRFHFGLTARLANAVRVSVHPLYSVSAAQAASRLTASELNANRVGFDLIARLAGYEYALEPLAEDRWSPTIVPELWRNRHGAIAPVEAGGHRLAPELKIRIRKLYQAKKKAAARPDSGLAKSMISKGRSGRFTSIPRFQKVIRDLLPGIRPDDELWDRIDRGQAYAVASADPDRLEDGSYGEHGRLVAANVSVLAHGLLWYLREDEPCAVSTPWPGPH